MKNKEVDSMKYDVNLNITDSRTVYLLETLLTQGQKILSRLERIMAKVDDLKAELVAANEVTNEIAADIADLVERTKGGLSPAEADEVGAQLTALKEKLAGVAAVHTPGSPV